MLDTVATKATPEERAAWEAAAKASGLSPHAWRRLVLSAAAGHGDALRQLKRAVAAVS